MFSVILPEATTNLVTNPSVERDTAGWSAMAGTILRTAMQQRRGVWSLQATPTSGVNDGLYFGTIGLTAGQTYTASVDVLGVAGVAYRIYFASAGGVGLGTATTFTATGRWQRIAVTYTEAATLARRVYVTKNNAASTAPFFVDGLQVENKAYATTYCDGDLTGFVPGEAAFRWTGKTHASTSTRSAQTRAGGKVVKLSDLGFRLIAFLGLGMAALVNIATPYALRGGAAYQRTIEQPREFSLVGIVYADDLAGVQATRKALVDALRPNRAARQQPLVLVFQGEGQAGVGIGGGGGGNTAFGDEMEIAAHYRGGLEGNVETTAPMRERASLQFEAFLPMIFRSGDSGAALSTSASVSNANYILRRNETGVWQALGTGMNGRVWTLLAAPDANLYAGGVFTTAGGGAASRVARWSGTAWAALGVGVSGGSQPQVVALAVGPDGAIYAAGMFTTAGGGAASNIAKWSGGSWSALGSGLGSSANIVNAIAFGPDGTLYAGGDFTSPANRIARWDGSTWSAMGSGFNGAVTCLTVGPDGSVYAAGAFTASGIVPMNRIARWNGTSWQALGSGLNDQPSAMAFGPDGNLYTTGQFETAGGVTVNFVARWNGTSWQALGSGFDSQGFDLAFGPDGTLYAGGGFDEAGGVEMPDAMARWNGSAWIPMDVDLPDSSAVDALAVTPDGVAIGFSEAGSATAAAVTTVTNGGSADAYPRVTFTGPGRLVQLVNHTTSDAIYFDLTLLSGEEATLDLAPDALTFTSTFRGNLLGTILPGSQTATWRLLPGANNISVLLTGGDANTAAALRWRSGYWGVDGGVP